MACIYRNASDVAGKHVTEAMKEYCKTDGCRRVFLMNYFGVDLEPGCSESVSAHLCCDNCRKWCCCSECSAGDIPLKHNTDTSQAKRIDPETRSDICHMLLQYFAMENAVVDDVILPESVTGLSQQFAHHISEKANKYSNYECLSNDFHHMDKHYLDNISAILSSVLEL